jgi:hypothetical protein
VNRRTSLRSYRRRADSARLRSRDAAAFGLFARGAPGAGFVFGTARREARTGFVRGAAAVSAAALVAGAFFAEADT